MPVLPQSEPGQDKKSFKQQLEELRRTLRERTLAVSATLFGLFLLLLPYLLEPRYPLTGWEWIYHLIRDIGIAAIVSAIVAFMLEKQSKRAIESHFNDRLQDFQDGISQGLVKGMYPNMPEELFGIVEESLLKAPFIRSIYRTDVELHDLTDDYINTRPPIIKDALTKCKACLDAGGRASKDIIVLEMRGSYEVKNTSGRTTDWVVPFQIAASFEETCPGQCGITLFEIDSQTPKIGRGNPKIYGSQKGGDPNVLGHEERISVKRGEKGFVNIHGYALRWAEDSEAWLVLVPSEGMTVRVADANDNKTITLTRLAPNPKNEESSATNAQGGAEVTLTIKQFLLPFQGIEIKWRRRV
jgi:hypothetical protein